VKHPRRAAVLLTSLAGVLAASACVVVMHVDEAPVPRPASQNASVAPVVQATASPSAEFVPPLLFVPAPPVVASGSGDDAGVLGPENVIIPTPAPALPLRAVIRPA
jgi:hypothetical protein